MLQSIANVLQILIALAIAYFVAFWFALVIWTFRDIQSRSQDFVVQVLATIWVAITNLPGFIIYLILRPSETLLDTYERSLEEESLLQDVENRLACPHCHQRIQQDFVVCPACLTRLKRLCSKCSRVLQLKWTVCPYCAQDLAGPEPPSDGRETVAPIGAPAGTRVRERPAQPTLVRD